MSSQMLVKNSKVPWYHQVAETLRESLARGEWRPGDLMPSEQELQRRFEVSRVTIRQAMNLLVNEGLIFRQRGRGTFVAHPTIEQGLARIVSFTEDMARRGFTPGTEMLESELIPASPEIAARLDVMPGEELARIRRLRIADDEPMSIEEFLC